MGVLFKSAMAYSSHASQLQGDFEGYRIKPPKLMALHHPLDDLTRVVIKKEINGNDNVLVECSPVYCFQGEIDRFLYFQVFHYFGCN